MFEKLNIALFFDNHFPDINYARFMMQCITFYLIYNYSHPKQFQKKMRKIFSLHMYFI